MTTDQKAIQAAIAEVLGYVPIFKDPPDGPKWLCPDGYKIVRALPLWTQSLDACRAFLAAIGKEVE